MTAAAEERGGVGASGGRAVTALPLRKLVPRAAWKIWTVGALLAAMGAAGLVAASWADQSGHPLAPVVTQVLGPAGGQMATAAACLLLVFGGQLALLIRWVRSRSLHDFAGRFGVWGWAAAASFTAAVSLLTGLHHAWGRLASLLGPFDAPEQMALAWLVPAVTACTVILGILLRDMDGCRASVIVIQFAAGCGLAAAVLSLDHLLPLPAEVRALPQNATALFAAAGLFLSLLLHARHVIYRSADPPQPRPTRRRPRLTHLLRLGLFRRRTAKQPAGTDETAEAGESGSTAAARKPSRTAPRKRRTPAARKTSPKTTAAEETGKDEMPANGARMTAEPEPPSVEDPSSEPEAVEEPRAVEPSTRRSPEPQPAGGETDEESGDAEDWADESDSQSRVDGPHDKSALKGLSKRERRKLQKEWRDQQRTGRK